MKSIWLLLVMLSFNAPVFSVITYWQIDSLSVGTSVDLDTISSPINTGYILRGNPYRAGYYYDPDFCCDLTVNGVGLLWCDCDGMSRISYFQTYRTTLSVDTLLKMEIDLMNSSDFNNIVMQHADGRYQLIDTGNYIIKTNKNNYCLVRFDATLSKSIAICGTTPLDSHYCAYAFTVKTWYQDDGTANFAYRTTATSPGQKRGIVSHSFPSYKAYDIKGRIVPYKNGRPDIGAGIIIIGNTVILHVK